MSPSTAEEANVATKKRKVDEGESDSLPTQISPIKRSDRFYEADGDLEILSSDNVLFKIEACHLQAASPVFRTMIASASASRLELCDPVLESEDVLNAFFDLIVNGTFVSLSELALAVSVVTLLKKFDCAKHLQQLHAHLRCALVDDDEPESSVLVLAALINKASLCNDAIMAALDSNWWDPDEGHVETHGDMLFGASVMDPAALDLTGFQAVDPKFMWTWLRAYRIAFPPAPHSDDDDPYRAMQRELQRLMALPGQSRPGQYETTTRGCSRRAEADDRPVNTMRNTHSGADNARAIPRLRNKMRYFKLAACGISRDACKAYK